MSSKSPSLTPKQKEILQAMELLRTASLEDFPPPSPKGQRNLERIEQEMRKFQRLENHCQVTSSMIYDHINAQLPDDLQVLFAFYRGLIRTRPAIDDRNYTEMLRYNRMAKQLLVMYQEPEQGSSEE